MDPWGTPNEMSRSGLTFSFIDTNCLRSVKYNLNHLSSVLRIPYLSSFFRSMLWLLVSKAFLRSQKMDTVCFFFFRESDILFNKCTIGWEVEWPARNWNCHLLKILLLSRKSRSLAARVAFFFVPFFSVLFQVFGNLWDPKERNILLQRTEKNARMFSSFAK